MDKYYVCWNGGEFVTLASSPADAIHRLWRAKYSKLSGIGLEALLAMDHREFAVQPTYWLHFGQHENGLEVSAARAWSKCPNTFLLEAFDWCFLLRYGSVAMDKFHEECFAC